MGNSKAIEDIQLEAGRLLPTPKAISESYHKAKADGSNPELVKAVEDLLGKPKETTPTPQTGKGEGDWSRDVESTAKALDSANGKELELLALKQSIKQLPDKDFRDIERREFARFGYRSSDYALEAPGQPGEYFGD